ncbi:hypothetical protein FNF31_05465 [Cafeteria roenbergensis]|uniref:Uncharacterized protein n=1 Tax=Cafeteria roenbergensis TaxID=33653 RepID=A0A5A8DLM9_CAFRO|nr:hypothetical protein FNF31_05465 [Cafeteria roenbergensis]KAA0166148.1 hypothetical protein FNF28_03197 [Cafeteria roenbergensis]
MGESSGLQALVFAICACSRLGAAAAYSRRGRRGDYLSPLVMLQRLVLGVAEAGNIILISLATPFFELSLPLALQSEATQAAVLSWLAIAAISLGVIITMAMVFRMEWQQYLLRMLTGKHIHLAAALRHWVLLRVDKQVLAAISVMAMAMVVDTVLGAPVDSNHDVSAASLQAIPTSLFVLPVAGQLSKLYEQGSPWFYGAAFFAALYVAHPLMVIPDAGSAGAAPSASAAPQSPSAASHVAAPRASPTDAAPADVPEPSLSAASAAAPAAAAPAPASGPAAPSVAHGRDLDFVGQFEAAVDAALDTFRILARHSGAVPPAAVAGLRVLVVALLAVAAETLPPMIETQIAALVYALTLLLVIITSERLPGVATPPWAQALAVMLNAAASGMFRVYPLLQTFGMRYFDAVLASLWYFPALVALGQLPVAASQTIRRLVDKRFEGRPNLPVQSAMLVFCEVMVCLLCISGGEAVASSILLGSNGVNLRFDEQTQAALPILPLGASFMFLVFVVGMLALLCMLYVKLVGGVYTALDLRDAETAGKPTVLQVSPIFIVDVDHQGNRTFVVGTKSLLNTLATLLPVLLDKLGSIVPAFSVMASRLRELFTAAGDSASLGGDAVGPPPTAPGEGGAAEVPTKSSVPGRFSLARRQQSAAFAAAQHGIELMMMLHSLAPRSADKMKDRLIFFDAYFNVPLKVRRGTEFKCPGLALEMAGLFSAEVGRSLASKLKAAMSTPARGVVLRVATLPSTAVQASLERFRALTTRDSAVSGATWQDICSQISKVGEAGGCAFDISAPPAEDGNDEAGFVTLNVKCGLRVELSMRGVNSVARTQQHLSQLLSDMGNMASATAAGVVDLLRRAASSVTGTRQTRSAASLAESGASKPRPGDARAEPLAKDSFPNRFNGYTIDMVLPSSVPFLASSRVIVPIFRMVGATREEPSQSAPLLEMVTRFIPDMVQAMNGVRNEAMHEQIAALTSTSKEVAGELRDFSAATEACNQLEDIIHQLGELGSALRLVEERHGVVSELISASANDSQPLTVKGVMASEELVSAIQTALWNHYGTLRQIRNLRPLLRDRFTLTDDVARVSCRARALELQEELEAAACGWGVVFGELAMETVLLVVLATGSLVEPDRMDHHNVSQAQVLRFALSGLVIFMSQLSPVVRGLADSSLVTMFQGSSSEAVDGEERQGEASPTAAAAAGADEAPAAAQGLAQPTDPPSHLVPEAGFHGNPGRSQGAHAHQRRRVSLAEPEEPMMLGQAES